MQSEQLNELFEALSKAQSEMTNGKATKQNPYLKNIYASIEDIWNEIRVPFFENGLSVTQLPQCVDGKNYLVTMLGHKSGQWVKSFTPLAEMSNSKNPMQDLGSALTYARRYGLSAICGFSVSDASDDDGQSCKSKEVSFSQRAQIEEYLDKFPDTQSAFYEQVDNNIKNMTIDTYKKWINYYLKRDGLKNA